MTIYESHIIYEPFYSRSSRITSKIYEKYPISAIFPPHIHNKSKKEEVLFAYLENSSLLCTSE